MSTSTYSPPDEHMSKLLDLTIDRYHSRLRKDGVCITMLAAYGPVDEDGETVGPAITHHGLPALGVVSIVKLKHRVAGLGDALLTIDGDAWHDMTDAKRIALLDHELTHITVVHKSAKKKRKPGELAVVEGSGTEVESEPALDSAGRPKLKMRKHDRTFGWFDEVAKRHGANSFEVEQATNFADDAGQYYLRGFDAVGE